MKGIRLENGKELFYDDVVVATGGMSYKTTGSDGDGYRFAEEAGLAVTPLRPALVPLENVWPTILTYSLAGGALVGGLGSMFSIRKHLNV